MDKPKDPYFYALTSPRILVPSSPYFLLLGCILLPFALI